MAIKKFYTKREKKFWKYDARKKEYWSWGYDIWLADGRRKREAGFMTESDAVAAVGYIRAAEKERKYGFVPDEAKPRLGELVQRRLADVGARKERLIAVRVLTTLTALVGADKIVEGLTTPDVRLYVERREQEGLSPATINRELNVVSSMLNNAAMYFPSLAQWRPPKLPRP